MGGIGGFEGIGVYEGIVAAEDGFGNDTGWGTVGTFKAGFVNGDVKEALESLEGHACGSLFALAGVTGDMECADFYCIEELGGDVGLSFPGVDDRADLSLFEIGEEGG